MGRGHQVLYPLFSYEIGLKIESIAILFNLHNSSFKGAVYLLRHALIKFSCGVAHRDLLFGEASQKWRAITGISNIKFVL